ncbi:bacillithiol biosynthesis cysteine-adding enzyme BshC [Sphingobacterium alkalisoli]|uniref:Putative cysteine ligase BshC n=1 Tax=Sphingobacterium alkalisoli TaxID=1874115 RepID=A0A4V5LZ94_9SPHI|nr:bacillithiol biosynthesis cysteine-adding enzyme BshC [Sphingobacterium alkalisoli]TJY67749.1 bacillithiol biosynthesis cysteine-adding enzyme BshC [Sphingobacterium alkalisoli]GGH11602.1 putative cysteine ligase BshC [Sphingobacterium alkalisoli]
MKATYIDYKDTSNFSKTLLAYLATDENLASFYGNSPDTAGFQRQIELKSSFEHRAVLVQQLQLQYGDLLSGSPEVAANIELLKSDNTFTVTTGHQLNIFTGPLYFIFKIVTAIRLASDLKKDFPDKEFVPIYWMATEDHDFEEINNTRVYGKKIVWDVPRVSGTGRMDTGSMERVVRQYCSMLGLSDNSAKLTAIVEEAYCRDRSLADATRVFVNALFREYGLVIVDADKPELKKLFAHIIQDDILHEKSFRAISDTSQQLEQKGFQAQVHARECNFFYLTDDFRERIVKNPDGRFEVLNQDIYFTEAEIITEIQSHPERFSPNVVMRPLYEEIILPNLAYIGGGAEIVYWLQLKANFDQFGVPFPILIPRNSAMITDDKVAGKIFRLDLTFKSIFKSALTLQNDYVKRHTTYRLNLKDEWMEINAIFGKIKLRTHKIDPSLGPSAEAVKARLKKAMNNLEKKLLKADKRNHEEALIHIERVKEQLFPGGGLQERTENFATLYIKYGDDLVKELVKHFHPLDFKFTILY